jgi:GNAT superfamily N-acetyltransferase
VARQERGADALAKDGGRIDVRELSDDEVALVDEVLPLHRLDGAQTYLVAWIDGDPVGHAHVGWRNTKLGVPEIQDVFVRPDRRRRGVASALSRAAEELAAAQGHDRISLGVSVANHAARQLYERLGYEDAGLPLERVQGRIMLRGRPFDVDDTMVYLVKRLSVDSNRLRSS